MSLSPSLPESRERLLNGVRTFRKNVYPGRRKVYEQAMQESQKPHTLLSPALIRGSIRS
jgi:hypothetical protein